MRLAVMPGQQVQSYAQPSYGLGGAERAVGQGFDGAMGAYNRNYGNAVAALQGGLGGLGRPNAYGSYAGHTLPWQPPGQGPNLESNAVQNYNFDAPRANGDSYAMIRGDAFGNTGIADGQTGRTADGRWTIASSGGTAGNNTRIHASETPHTSQQWTRQGQEFAEDYGQRANAALGQARTDIGNGLTAFNTHMDGARGDINQGINAGLSRLDTARSGYDPYRQTGGQAFDAVSALSGALGSDAQQTAYNNFNESPGQAWLREQGERSVLRNAAATGGLGSGRVLKELQREGMGLAAQDFDNYYNRLAGLADVGMRATDAQSGIDQTAAGMENNRGVALAGINQAQGQGNLNTAENLANIQGQMSGNLMNTGNTLAGLSDSMSNQLTSRSNARTAAGATVAAAGIGANASMRNAQLAANTDLTNSLANAYMNLGNNQANLAYNTGNNLAGMRYDTGQNIANANLLTGNNIGQNIQNTGQLGAGVVGQGANDLSNVLGTAGQANAQGRYGLGQGLAGVNSQLVGGLSGTNNVNNVQFNPGTLSNVGNFLGGLGGFMGAF